MVPKRRFRDFENEWVEMCLNDLSESFAYGLNAESKEYDGKNKYIRITDIDDDTRMFDGSDLTSPNIDYEVSNDYILSEGDILFARTGASVGKTYIYDRSDGKVYYAGFLIKARIKNEYYSEFIFQNTLTKRYKNFVHITSQRSGQPGINAQEYSTFKLFMPTIEEQQKIGEFFKILDERIANQKRKIAKVKALKSAYLTEIFPQEGETVPKRRFKGFEEEWISIKLSDLTEYANGMGHERLVVPNGKFELVNLNSISIEGIFKPSGKFVDESSRLLEKNDLIMILSDVGHGGLLGRVALIPENEKYVLNQRVASLKPNELVNPLFLYFNINKNQKYFKYKGAGMSQLNISKEIVEDFIVYMPCKEEQQKIGAFFKNLDNQIVTEEKKLNKLKKMKEAYLEEMFV